MKLSIAWGPMPLPRRGVAGQIAAMVDNHEHDAAEGHGGRGVFVIDRKQKRVCAALERAGLLDVERSREHFDGWGFAWYVRRPLRVTLAAYVPRGTGPRALLADLGKRLAVVRARCPHCGRPPRECWIMPCLVVERFIARADAGKPRELRAWARAMGAELRRNPAFEAAS